MLESREVMSDRSAPDPSTESIGAPLAVRLARELRSLLKTELEGPDDSSVALGARGLAALFSSHVPAHRISIEAARAVRGVDVDGFTAWPIFITYVGGCRDPYAPVYNQQHIEERLRDFYASGFSKIRGAIGEAIRNVGQHGHQLDAVGYQQCLFAPGAILVKEIALENDDTPASRVLVAMVTDEGGGISDPERSVLNGVGSVAGVDSLGMGIEMEGSLLYLVKSSRGEWSLFDGARQINPDKYDSSRGFRRRIIGENEKIERVSSLYLPAPSTGCQKIMFFAHPSATAEDVRALRQRLLLSLMTLGDASTEAAPKL
jgi:anti-sigma regulatory factor (Ser/Thr protein kinase)